MGSWWHQALTTPVPSFTPLRVAGLSLTPQTPPYPRARGQDGPGQPQASSACGGAELEAALRGCGSGSHLAATGAPRGPGSGPQPRPQAAEPSPRHTGPAPAPAPPGVPCASPGCRQSTQDCPWQGQSQRGSRTHLSQRAGTSHRAARPWPCWSWQRPWHHPRLEAERRQLSTTPTAPREPKHSPVLP